jgi:hypothetical protein
MNSVPWLPIDSELSTFRNLKNHDCNASVLICDEQSDEGIKYGNLGEEEAKIISDGGEQGVGSVSRTIGDDPSQHPSDW